MESSVALGITFALSFINAASCLQVKQNELINKEVPGDCKRGFDCGYNVSVPEKPSISIPCSNGAKWFSERSLLLRGRNGTSAIYCFVNKVASSYMFNIMKALGMPYRDGIIHEGGMRDGIYFGRDLGYDSIGQVAERCKENPADAQCKQEINQICNADASLVLVRNPWDRIASAYVDKVLNKWVFSEPPSFNEFLKTLPDWDPTILNEHFRPLSRMCHTTGTDRQNYDTVLRIEKPSEMREGLRDFFVSKLKFPEDEVVHALENGAHHASDHDSQGIDKSITSELNRTTYYFKQSDPELVRKIYADDIEFGTYSFTWGQLASMPLGGKPLYGQ